MLQTVEREKEMTPKQLMDKAQISVLMEEPFFGSLLMHLRFVEDKNVPTACTDGNELRWNPDFIATLDKKQVAGLLVHEVEHCALGHIFRFKGADMQRANIATDYEINNLLDNYRQECEKKGRYTCYALPEGALINHSWDDKSAEEIYNLLPKPTPQDQDGDKDSQQSNGNGPQSDDGQGKGQSPWGEFKESPSPSESEQKEHEARWKVAVTQAAAQAKQQGKLPGCMARLVDELLNPKVDWREALRQFVSSYAKTDFSWSRPNKKYFGTGFILPSLHSNVLGPVLIAGDCSGSMWEEVKNVFSEASAVLDLCKPEKLIFTLFDSEIQGWHELEQGDQLPSEAKGFGGTDFRCVFEEMDKRDVNPVCVIVITDGYGTFPTQEPPFPVLWAMTTDVKAPFGETIKM